MWKAKKDYDIEWDKRPLLNFTNAKQIAIDLETYDPELLERGSGAIRGVGHIAGIAVAIDDQAAYYPIGHTQGNVDREAVLKWFGDLLTTPADKIFHNAMYDMSWIRKEGFKVNGTIYDTMIMASLIDENRFRYTLDSLAKDYLQERKQEDLLQEGAKKALVDAKKEMYKINPTYVGNYAEQDANLTLGLYYDFLNKIKGDQRNDIEIREKRAVYTLENIFKLETDLFPCLLDMKFKGVRVDTYKAKQLKKELEEEEGKLNKQIKDLVGFDVNIYAASSIADAFKKLDIKYHQTSKGAPSFTKNFLSAHEHELPRLITKAREINKAHTTFIDTILKHEHEGRIHADINQLRSDDGGTVSGRFSYANPNLQQIPARNKDLGPKIRSLFIPEDNHFWGCFDYSQQEPRLVAHYAVKTKVAGGNLVADEYAKNPKVDFHQIVADMAQIPRSQAKTINLGLFYGMGKAKLQTELGIEADEADDLLSKYHKKIPFIKELTKMVMRYSNSWGRVKTIEGRLCRFNRWQPDVWGERIAPQDEETANKLREEPWVLEEDGTLKLDDKQNKIPNPWYNKWIKRAFTYKALNRLIQGSAADMTKKSMVELYKKGIIAHIQIHDELDLSVKSRKEAKDIMKIMENAVKLGTDDHPIPNKVDYKFGKNWGDIYDK
ncbi:MAG: DNA polymerase [Pelagibacteraceae bacterium]